jgi:hypothetical protein
MDTIEKAHAEIAVMVKAALDRKAFTVEEIMESVRDALRVVVEETTGQSPGELRARIAKLGNEEGA